MERYDVLAPFYDAVMGDRAEAADYVRSLVEKHRPDARRVLELACGTGSVLQRLEPHYDVTGVDISRRMLELARRKVPQARLVEGDMTRLSLGETFDAVLCVFDSINHVLTFAGWEAVFDRAHEHLRERGIFVFDVNTPRKLAQLAAVRGPQASWFGGDNLLLLDVADADDGTYLWSLRVFEHVGGSDYRLHAEEIPEAAFEVERIKEALAERFARIRTYDAEQARPTATSLRLHFVCERR